ncbi:MAG: hypothetical protein V2I25_00340 [Woeseiaceae bacterium]|jgi:hypothetical protein|nr:hypothetical protein [Woeseiaceae bacterium]
MSRPALLAALLVAATANGQSAEDWELENGYTTNLLYLHALVNYAWDLEDQANWERRRFADNALRVNTGSVSSDELLTDVEININEPLNEQWRFFGQFTRQGARRRPGRGEQLLLGLERTLFGSSAVYVSANPEFGKEFLDIEAGYGWYAPDREHYLRVGLRAEDTNWGTKNKVGGTQEQDPLKLVWALRLGIGERAWLYSEGKAGSGYERRYDDAELSPDIAREERNETNAEIRLGMNGEQGRIWSLAAEWYEFEERRDYRSPGLDYDYSNRQLNIGIEHIRPLGERHRLRLLAQFVDQEASSRGFRQHDYDRQDILAGIFYEYRWVASGVTIAYAAGQPDFAYDALDAEASIDGGDYTDKLILGYRYTFSDNALIRASIAHEVSETGFGGGAVQFQMFF